MLNKRTRIENKLLFKNFPERDHLNIREITPESQCDKFFKLLKFFFKI